MNDFVDMDKVNSEHIKWDGSQNRTCAPDRLFPLPEIGPIDRYSRCFVTQEAHVSKKDQNYCVACEKVLSLY